MALFNDGPISTLEDLRAYESSVLDTASTEGIDVSHKIRIAQREIAAELLRFLIGRLEPAETVTPAKLGQVAVTDPLAQWHALRALAVLFRDVHHHQLNDRYKAKWEVYEREAIQARERYFAVGVGLVFAPMPRPALSVTQLTADPASTLALVSAAWVNGAGVESALSEPLLAEPAGSLQYQFTVGAPPSSAAGWHVYAGESIGLLKRQTTAPLALDAAWILPDGLASTGPAPGPGQPPNTYVRQQRVLVRG